MSADSTSHELVDTMAIHAAIVGAVVEISTASARGFHPLGAADPSGFAAMACDEMLIHTDDVARCFGIDFDPPVDVVEAVLARLFPWVAATGDAWAQLRWANGRIAVQGQPRLTRWAWHCAPLDEWDGTISTGPSRPQL